MSTGQRSAADTIEYLQKLPLLSARDKRGVLGLIRHTLAHDFVNVLNTHNGISIFRSTPDHDLNSNRIYRVSGMGEVPEDPRVVFELLCDLELIPEWDMLYKGAKYLSFIRDPEGRCEVGYIHLVYGLPGVSQFVSDRDFILRTVRVFFPNGMHVLYCHSVGPGECISGSPGQLPHMIRGQMWDSGYVVVPTAAGCCLNITLQVDPKGWIPTSVVNFSLEAIPLNIQRIRAALDRLPPAILQQLSERNKHQASACNQLPPVETLGSGSTGLYTAYSSVKKGSGAPCPTDGNSGGGAELTAASGGGKLVPGVPVAPGVHDALGGGRLFWTPVSRGGSPDSSAGSNWQGVDAPEGEEEESSEWFDA